MNDDPTRYRAVVNHELQFSIWPEGRESPIGWGDAGFSGTKEECLAFIERTWTDMRPASLRDHIDTNPQ